MKHFTHCMVVAGMIALATPVAAQQMATQLLPVPLLCLRQRQPPQALL